jgi:GT2 family glycosyltransferase/glycosyltransferase involved in cell wall biosynthesis
VSVVVVNYRGAEDTIACLDGLRDLDYEDLEVIVVDNASGDGSAEVLTARFPDARVLALEENTGFAGGCNHGAAQATGQYLAFLNNDARPDPAWLRVAVETLHADTSIACVASKVLDWEGETVDFVDAAMSFYGHAFKLHVGAPDGSIPDKAADVLFASGAAMVMPTDIFERVGGFDPRYFMFFEDVDLGWRLWLYGYRVRYVPESLVYHRHHQSMGGYGAWREQYLLERNALFTIFKNYDDDNLGRVLPAALMLAVRRGVTLGGADAHELDLARGSGGEQEPQVSASKQTLASTYAVDALVEEIESLAETRRTLQAARRRSDQEIFRLFRMPFHPNIGDPQFVDGFNAVVDAFSVKEVFTERRRILVATGDTLAPQMAGPAIRAWQIACALCREHDVELVTTIECRDISHPDFRVRKVTDHELSQLVNWADVTIFQGYLMNQHPALLYTNKVIVADIYDPFHLEQLEQARDAGEAGRRVIVRAATEVLNQQLTRGDLFLCASRKQRDFWLGQLAAVGRVNPVTYDADETMNDLVKVVPFGVSDDAPQHTRPVLKGVVPGIGPDDKVILWGGGIYNWFDPLTLLRAVDKLRARVPGVRLFFLGLKHPNPNVPEMRMAVETRRLADELGLTDTHVFFNEGWVAYDDRQNFLLESDIGVSTHLDHVETEFSFRTRILDYLWASLPVVATGGDSFGDIIEAHGVGLTVPPGDVDALEAALFQLLDDEELAAGCRAASGRLSEEYRWTAVLEPLIEFCRSPHRAPDLVDPDMAAAMPSVSPVRGRIPPVVIGAARLLRDGDLKMFVRKAGVRVKRGLAAGR